MTAKFVAFETRITKGNGFLHPLPLAHYFQHILFDDRHVSRFMGTAVKINIVPDEKNENRPDFTVVIALALEVIVQKLHQHTGVEKLFGCFACKRGFYNIIIFFFPHPNSDWHREA